MEELHTITQCTYIARLGTPGQLRQHSVQAGQTSREHTHNFLNMNELSTEQTSTIQRYLREYNPGHDDTQIEFFVIGNNYTDFGRYRQCLAEISTHYEGLKTSYILRKKKQAEKKIIEAEIAELED